MNKDNRKNADDGVTVLTITEENLAQKMKAAIDSDENVKKSIRDVVYHGKALWLCIASFFVGYILCWATMGIFNVNMEKTVLGALESMGVKNRNKLDSWHAR